MDTKNLIEEVFSLPVEERVIIADSILKSLNTVNPEIDQKWIKAAKRRLDDLKTGKIKAVPGNEVFNKIWERFSH